MEFLLPEVPGRKIPWNFCHRRSQDEKFYGISVAGGLRTKNSAEFLLPEVPRRKIPWNFCRRRFQDEKFRGIPDIDICRMEKSIKFHTYTYFIIQNNVQP
jgi:hypothetical protein